MKLKIVIIALAAVICLIVREPIWMTVVLAVCIAALMIADIT